MKRLYDILGIASGAFFGVFIGMSIFQIYDYTAYPDIYTANSAPWYTGMAIHGVMTLIVVIICLSARLALRKKFGFGKKQ